MSNINIDEITELVKRIVENIQCATCAKTDGKRIRYYCGHTTCDDCAIDGGYCQVCFTSSWTSSLWPKPDDALTQRVQNSTYLLKAFQDLFHTDVFKRKRQSEQLRIEKEVFPKCIQAPVKYGNKRKSTNFSYNNKENRNSNIFPGEETSPLQKKFIMESSVNYVQQWLNKNEKDVTRKPFRDLNIISTQLNSTVQRNSKKAQSNHYDYVPVLKENRKRSHFKTTISSLGANKKSIKKYNSNSKKIKTEIHETDKEDHRNEAHKGCDNDESGIFMDNDPIFIDDSQEINDKDKSAWLAVLEAHKNGDIESTSIDRSLDFSEAKVLTRTNKHIPNDSGDIQIQQGNVNNNNKVCFYKKSYITERCVYCKYEANNATDQAKKLNITINNDNFTTTINILNNTKENSKLNTTNSVSTQTDISETIAMYDEFGSKDAGVRVINVTEKNYSENAKSPDARSEDLFADEGNYTVTDNDKSNIHNFLVIEESDSDIDINESGPLPVKVDVHRSCDQSEYGILGEIDNIEHHNARPRRGPRGLTPTSTDSSEKENYNPNRLKKRVSQKKKKV